MHRGIRLVRGDITQQHVDAIVVSAGWDAHERDPLSRLKVTTGAYARAAEILAGLNLPTVILQEGGYSLAAVSEAAPTFLEAFAGAQR